MKVEKVGTLEGRPFRRETRPAQSERIPEGRNLLLERGDVRLAPGVILAEIDRLTPKLAHGLSEEGHVDGFGRLGAGDGKNLSSLEKISIDFAVMENADAVVMLESSFDWDASENGPQSPGITRRTKMERVQGVGLGGRFL